MIELFPALRLHRPDGTSAYYELMVDDLGLLYYAWCPNITFPAETAQQERAV